MLGGLVGVTGLTEGILTITVGIIIIVKPKVIAWLIGIYLIAVGVLAVISALL